jgi:MFS transporter, ACS family, solute carrier family 17 (sodium-dependent inorganic phosphate cotransporter), other
MPSSEVRTAQARSWPARYTLVGLCFGAVFVCYIDRVSISVAVIAMQAQFGWSETIKGLVLSSFFIGYLLFQVPAGYLANRFGGKLVLGAAVIWWSLATMITPAAAMTSLVALVAARVAMGLGEAATFPASYSLFSQWVPAGERARAVSFLMSGVPIGTLFALSVTGWMVVRYGWPSAFYVFGVVGMLWAIVWFAVVRDAPVHAPATLHRASPGASVPWRQLFSSSAVWALIINHFCSNWALYVLLAWLPSYFTSQGLDVASASLFSAAPWLTMFVIVNVVAWGADRMVRQGRSLTLVRKTMQTVGLVGSAGFLLLAPGAQSATTALLIMCGALGTLGFTWSGFAPNHLDIAPRHADVLMGVTNTAGTLPGVIGVLITGWLVDITGTYTSAFILAAAINVGGALVWLAFSTAKPIVELDDSAAA